MLVANVRAPAPEPLQEVAKKPDFGDILTPALWLAGALLLAALVFKIIKLIRESQRRQSATDDSVHGQLSHFRKAFERGELSEVEYDRVYKLLTGQVRKQAGLQSEKPAEAPPADAPAPPRDATSGNGQAG